MTLAVTQLPHELWHMICLQIHCPRTLLCLSFVIKQVEHVIATPLFWQQWQEHDSTLFWSLWYDQRAQKCQQSLKLALVSNTCEMCGVIAAIGDDKRYHVFGIRSCTRCCDANLVSPRHFPRQFPRPLLSRLKTYYGFYWKPHLERLQDTCPIDTHISVCPSRVRVNP